jgi:hypothetical protein
VLARLQADSGLPSRDPAVVGFYDRPYLCIEPTLVPAVVVSITDPALRALPAGLGSVEQRSDNVAVLVDGRRRAGLTRRTHSPEHCGPAGS